MKKILALAGLITLSGNFIPNFIATNVINNNSNTSLKLNQNEKTVVNFDQLMKDAAVAAFKEEAIQHVVFQQKIWIILILK